MCIKCNIEMALQETNDKKYIYGLYWRCSNWKCNTRYNVYHKSLFKGLKISLKTIYLLMDFFKIK